MICRPIKTKDDKTEAIIWHDLIETKHLKTGFILKQSNTSQGFYKGQSHYCQATSLFYNVDFDNHGTLVLFMQNYVGQIHYSSHVVTVICSN
jgi:hypothetical protein